jgi:hypothetical protein
LNIFIYLDIAKNTPKFDLKTGRFIAPVETRFRSNFQNNRALKPTVYTIEKNSKRRYQDICELKENPPNEYYNKPRSRTRSTSNINSFFSHKIQTISITFQNMHTYHFQCFNSPAIPFFLLF